MYSELESPRAAYMRSVADLAQQAKSILDIGCGYAAPALEGLPNEAILKVGTDVVEGLRPSEATSVRFVQADCSQLPFADESFDIVICRSVLEHLEKPAETFQEISRVLTPGGTFVFLTPNRWDYISLGASLVPNTYHGKLVKRLTGREEENTFPTVYGANSTRRIRSLAKQSGLGVSQLRLIREHPHYLKFNAAIYLVAIIYEQTVQRFLLVTRPWILGVCHRQSNRGANP